MADRPSSVCTVTSEIAIINRSAIALATDSAVTLESNGESKVYNSVNKLFTLSKYDPIGVMIYGGASHMGFPWEVLIKQFREDLGRISFPTLREYVEAFFDFLDDPKRSRVPTAAALDDYKARLADVLDELRGLIRDQLQRADIEWGQGDLPNKGKGPAADICISIIKKAYADAKLLPQFGGDYEAKFFKAHGEMVRGLAAKVLGWSDAPQRVLESIDALALRVAASDRPTRRHSGLVFAGFGQDEILPVLESYLVDGGLDGHTKYIQQHLNNQARDDPDIFSFAQSESSQTFIFGLDPRMKQLLFGIIDQAVNGIPEALLDLIEGMGADEKQQAKEQWNELAPPIVDELKRKLLSFQDEEHIAPLQRILASLPKDEMAEMAEALVHLSYMKRRFSMTLESVGGPIDVAVISKGDGFIWIKRKHYFDPTLNPQFKEKYFLPRNGDTK